MKLFWVIVLFVMAFETGFAQPSKRTYRVFTGNGKKVDVGKVIKAIGKSDVVFLGETHDDTVAHALQLEIFRRSFEKYGKRRKVALSLEMFERDVQIVLDEYLAGLITEKHFLASSRPWGNYKTDYRPLVEYAKEKKLNVFAANAPRRYVNMVSRSGRASVNKLSAEAKGWLAPLPFGRSSKVYAEKITAMLGGHGSQNILDSQALWDTTMSYWVSQNLKKDGLIIHLNGSFHTEGRLGTVEHLLKYRPGTKALVVTMKRVKDFKQFNRKRDTGSGDFVILTDEKQPKSKR